MPEPIAFLAALPDQPGTAALSVYPDGNASLRLSLDASQVPALTAEWPRLVDKLLSVAIVPEGEGGRKRGKRG